VYHKNLFPATCLGAGSDIGPPAHLRQVATFPTFDPCGGVGLSEDGRFVYLRRADGRLTKIDPQGKVIWESQVPTGYVPTAPTEQGGMVGVCSGVGLVSAVDAATGRVRWQYQATPQLYVLSRVTVSQGVAYVSGMDGSVTALTGPR
jgi:outer membrane protein assembly factor BamB